MATTKQMEAANTLLTTCSGCKPDERILIVADDAGRDVADIMWQASAGFANRALVMMDEMQNHGEEPGPLVAAALQNADVIFASTRFSLTHAPAKKKAVAGGARFVNLVDYSMDMMERGGLFCDFDAMRRLCDHVADNLRGKKTCEITAPSGTHLTCSIEGRSPSFQYGVSLQPGTSSSPPCIGVSTCAVEGSMNGVVYIDGSIEHPDLRLITQPIKLTIEKGRITAIDGGEQADILKRVLADVGDENAYCVGEIGLGLNEMCELNGRMLADEGCGGTIHLGCGDNRGFGGITACPVHLDIVFQNPSMVVDGITVMDNGKIL